MRQREATSGEHRQRLLLVRSSVYSRVIRTPSRLHVQFTMLPGWPPKDHLKACSTMLTSSWFGAFENQSDLSQKTREHLPVLCQTSHSPVCPIPNPNPEPLFEKSRILTAVDPPYYFFNIKLATKISTP